MNKWRIYTLLTWTDVEEVVHNLHCLWSVLGCCQEDLLEKACNGLELIRVKLLLQHSLVYQITEKCAAIAIATTAH